MQTGKVTKKPTQTLADALLWQSMVLGQYDTKDPLEGLVEASTAFSLADLIETACIVL